MRPVWSWRGEAALGVGWWLVGSIDGPYHALECVIYCFLVKFTNEKELVTDRRTDR